MKYKIRKEIMNMTLSQWSLLGDRDFFIGTPEEFLNEIGLIGCLTSKTTELEDRFFAEMYEIWRNNQNTEN